MIRFLIRKLLYGILVLIGVASVVFMLFHLLPGDPARMVMGQRADVSSLENIRKEMGLDQPLLTQYVLFMNDISPVSLYSLKPNTSWSYDPEKQGKGFTSIRLGNKLFLLKKPYLRQSYQSKRPVSEILAEAFPKTLLLAFTAISMAVIVGIIIGVYAALHQNKLTDRLALIFSVLGMSSPSFFSAILNAWIFGFLLAGLTGLSMYGSLYSVDELGRGSYVDLKNLILPALTLGIRPLAIVIELTRSSMLEVLEQDYIRTARAKGLSLGQIIWKHALRNALNPVLTAVSGWFASLLAGAVFVEYIFDWKGLGLVIVESLDQYDLPVIMGSVLLISVILVIINIFVDIIYAWIDPRVVLK